MSEEAEQDEKWLKEEKKSPWACEIEFFGKPSIMLAVLEYHIDDTHVTLVLPDESIVEYPYESVTKITILHTR